MRPGAFVVNVGRGSVIDEDAITAALQSGRLGGYAADVFAMEDWMLPGHRQVLDGGQPDHAVNRPRSSGTRPSGAPRNHN
jgi:lactate dehydrogenase-like 2-hydroxyacid dehydrogenase